MNTARISLVTPCFNSATYLEATIRSVLDQQDPNLEYIIIDGGSTDGSQEIIARYADRLAYWTSEKDGGMYDAIQKGFARASGDVMAWLNADDLYFPWTFQVVRAVFEDLPEAEWISSLRPLLLNPEGVVTDAMALKGFSQRAFRNGENLPGFSWYSGDYIQQESTFWRRSLWERSGAHLNTQFRLAGDFELWARFYQHAELTGVRTPIGGFRVHAQQQTATGMARYREEALQAFNQNQGKGLGRLHSWARRNLGPVTPAQLRRVGAAAGWLYPTQIAVFNMMQQRWHMRREYF